MSIRGNRHFCLHFNIRSKQFLNIRDEKDIKFIRVNKKFFKDKSLIEKSLCFDLIKFQFFLINGKFILISINDI